MYKRELQQTARKSLFLKLLHLPYGILIPILISTEGNERACGEDEERSDDGSRHSGNRVFCYTYFTAGWKSRSEKKRNRRFRRAKMKQYRTIFANSFEKHIIPGLGKIWKIWKTISTR